ncbi:hypothetical protein [Cytobacillus oceanisediminis]|uniref:hypothetical protein n=1 Tax=Cytobacillus oceanisediminis TaxID=665099 RepID=UPI003735090B
MHHQPIRAWALLSDITKGKATIYDLAAELRRLGLNFSYSELLEKTRPKINSRIVQRVPQVPFILNGTMYDPKDIIRFNGQELHFVIPPSGDHMLVVDNIELLNAWKILENHELLGYQKMRRVPPIPQPGDVGDPGGEGEGDLAPMPGFGQSLPPHQPPTFRTYFYSEKRYKGFPLMVKGKVRDLRRLQMGVTGLYNWDKKISSVSNIGSYRDCVLFEGYNFYGPSLMVRFGYQIEDLARFGWDNRASSVGQIAPPD